MIVLAGGIIVASGLHVSVGVARLDEQVEGDSVVVEDLVFNFSLLNS